jgi:hypothetical protein
VQFKHIFFVFHQAARLGSKGLQWSSLRDDPNCGMGTVLIIFVIEWPLFLLISLYLDQVSASLHCLNTNSEINI